MLLKRLSKNSKATLHWNNYQRRPRHIVHVGKKGKELNSIQCSSIQLLPVLSKRFACSHVSILGWFNFIRLWSILKSSMTRSPCKQRKEYLVCTAMFDSCDISTKFSTTRLLKICGLETSHMEHFWWKHRGSTKHVGVYKSTWCFFAWSVANLICYWLHLHIGKSTSFWWSDLVEWSRLMWLIRWSALKITLSCYPWYEWRLNKSVSMGTFKCFFISFV